jgi:hypothetical protein
MSANIQQLLQDRWTGEDLLRAFVCCHVQQLQQREVSMCMYPGPSFPNRSFSAELDDAEIDAWIRRILVYKVNQNSGPSPVPQREGPSAHG